MLVHLRIMMGWISTGRDVALSRVAACALAWGASACSSAEGESTLFEPLQPPGTVRDVPPDPPAMPSPPSTTPSVSVMEPAENPINPPPTETEMPVENGDRQPGACQPALGVSGAPETIPQALVLLNTLPKPTTLECFLQALDRPLNVYFTSSNLSLQPAPDARHPRTFVQRGELYMSLVFGGAASDTLEFGYRPTPGRSIKAEITFPLRRDLTEETLFEPIALTDTTTQCGACHTGEARETFAGFPNGVYASDIFEPYESLEIPLETMRTEAQICDETVEEARCALLSALFENGELVQGELPGKPR